MKLQCQEKFWWIEETCSEMITSECHQLLLMWKHSSGKYHLSFFSFNNSFFDYRSSLYKETYHSNLIILFVFFSFSVFYFWKSDSYESVPSRLSHVIDDSKTFCLITNGRMSVQPSRVENALAVLKSITQERA